MTDTTGMTGITGMMTDIVRNADQCTLEIQGGTEKVLYFNILEC
jgi:hypothetical protein